MRKRNLARMTVAGCVAALTGCSLTPEYGCRAPDGVTCMSASEVYDRDARGEVIRPKLERPPSEDEPLPKIEPFRGPTTVKPGEPIFREPRRLRLWVVDWEDDALVYHPNHYLHLRVDDGEWLLPAMRAKLLGEDDGFR